MASERDKMNRTAQRYIDTVKKAARTCADAKSQIAAAQAGVFQNWQSDAGKALADALADACAKLERVNNNLITAQGMMYAEAKVIYDNWPEDGE